MNVKFVATLIGCALAPLTLALCASPARAGSGLGPATVVSGTLPGCTTPRVVYGAGERVRVTFASAGEVFSTHSGVDFAEVENVSASVVPSSSQPDMVNRSFFVVDVVFREQDIAGGDGEIFLVDNNGGSFGVPVALSDDGLDEMRPRLHRGNDGSLVATWTRMNGGDAEVVLWLPSGAPMSAALGTEPCVLSRGGGTAFVAYLRGSDVHGRVFDGLTLQPEFTIASIPSGATSLSAVVDNSGVTHLFAVVGGDLHATADDGALAFGPTTIVTSGLVGPVEVAIGVDQTLAYIASQGASLEYGVYRAGAWSSSSITGTALGASDIAVDPYGYGHVVYIDDGQVRYANDGEPPVASFTAAPTFGQLPLTVAFDNQSTGVLASVSWDFGDGATSSQFSPSHTYTTPGPFTVSLTIDGPSGSDSLVESNLIFTSLPPNNIRMAHITTAAGASIAHAIRADHDEPLQGFQIGLVYDDGIATFTGASYAASATAVVVQPEFTYAEAFPNGADSELVIAAVLDFAEPYQGYAIPVGHDQVLVTILYDIGFPLPEGSAFEWRFVDGVGDPPIDNVFATSDGTSVTPYFLDGSVTVASLPTELFLRGDANGDVHIDIADAIFMLVYFFSDGTAPPCQDAADSNDDGILDVGDAIFVLSFLFADYATTFHYPYPLPGLDPTADSLIPCSD